ncbi:triphosphoribosyl-dephospho-CoA synthase MdcB [Caldimonas tepidiphila]|uniref:triphosphoribosyl-dephospho-CoA synthase MdcB n=1 Tax=Caldimonas tepidiphila TaxID=2315841 RepID=UPI000E5ADBA5|nr:triphosphoribosyl-dephospho-CoA synthase MdcB [Caldimonas tepidiphila]
MRRAGCPSAAEQRLGAAAVRALYVELTLEPKPGLVSLRDTGSHADMDAATFVRSLFALRHYFPRIAQAGARGAPFAALRALGVEAEARMLSATGGVNTHRGAVFLLGLLCAAGGRLLAQRRALDAGSVRESMRQGWGRELAAHAAGLNSAPPRSNGQRAARAHGLRSACDEAAAGFPTLFDVTLPALQAARRSGLPERQARVQALFETIAALDDTNLVHRGGIDGLRFAQRSAADFVAGGGVRRPDWLERGRALHAEFVARRLSPGGAADLLGAACWLEAVTAPVPAALPQAELVP